MSWEYLDQLAKEYYEIGSHDTRTPRQIEIANEIAVNCLPLVTGIAKDLKYSNVKMPGGKYIRVKKSISIEDLIQEGCLALIISLKNYNPEREQENLSQFLIPRIATAMYRSQNQENMYIIKKECYHKYNRIVRNKGIEGVLDSHSFYRASLIALGINNNWKELGQSRLVEVCEDYEPKNSRELTADLRFPSEIIEEEDIPSQVYNPEKLLERKLNIEAVRTALQELSERKGFVIRAIFWGQETLTEIGDCMEISPQRVDQIKKEAIQELKEKLKKIK